MKSRRWVKVASVAGAVLFAAIAVAVVVWLLFAPHPPAADPETSAPGTPAEQDDRPRSPADAADGGFPETVLDEHGLAEMTVTTDPAEAAESAAAVLWSVDTSRFDYAEDFRREAITRIMRPSPEYVGADDQIETTLDREKSNLGHTEWVRGDVVEATLDGVQRETYSPEGGWWWALGDDRSFHAYQARNAVIISHPIEVLDAEQMEKFDPGVKRNIQDSWSIEKPGASIHRFWVRVETSTVTGDGSNKDRNPAAMVVYCDPPADGGICGVAVVTRDYPVAWQRPL
jgi:hypothetical protein